MPSRPSTVVAAFLLSACGADPAPGPTVAVESARYRVSLETDAPAAGGAGRLRLRVEPTEGHHLSVEAPVSVRFEDVERVRFEPSRPGPEAVVARSETGLELETAYRPSPGGDPGEGRATARLRFGVCRADVCTIERPSVPLALPRSEDAAR